MKGKGSVRYSAGSSLVILLALWVTAGATEALAGKSNDILPEIGSAAPGSTPAGNSFGGVPTAYFPGSGTGVFEAATPPITSGFSHPCGGPQPAGQPVGDPGTKKRHPGPLHLQAQCGSTTGSGSAAFDISPIVSDLTGGSAVAPPGSGEIEPLGQPVGDTSSKKRPPAPLLSNSADTAPSSTPEPGAFVLLGTGLVGLFATRRRLTASARQGRR